MNAIKHAQADTITLILSLEDKQPVLKIQDNGTGFLAIEFDQKGMGVAIMKYRAAIIGAALSFISDDKNGTTVTCCMTEQLQEETGHV